MNLFELIAMICIAVGLVGGFWLGVDDGAWAGMSGALRGAAIAYGWFVAAMFLMLTLFRVCLWYRPIFPRCRNGRCRMTDYRYLCLDDESPTGFYKTIEERTEGKVVRCACGTVYVDCGRDRRFYEVLEDGTLLPFMRYGPLGRWQPDSTGRGDVGPS